MSSYLGESQDLELMSLKRKYILILEALLAKIWGILWLCRKPQDQETTNIMLVSSKNHQFGLSQRQIEITVRRKNST